MYIELLFFLLIIIGIICHKYDMIIILLIVFLYYMNSKENFKSGEAMTNVLSLLSDEQIIVDNLIVYNGANIGGVQFNCQQIQTNNGIIPNNTNVANILKTIPISEETTQEYLNSYNNVISSRNNGPNAQIYSLIAPETSVLSEINFSVNNGTSLTVPNISTVNMFNGTSNSNSSVPVPINTFISQEYFNNPTMEQQILQNQIKNIFSENANVMNNIIMQNDFFSSQNLNPQKICYLPEPRVHNN